ncbi:GNAT family N-acetyltransferase [Streptomyces venetus]|uniref:GNAT family N-acetyltransferase n=1 Tax=Streptomyces venetus TaxID=1701086 RepID=UPI003C2B27AE
MFDVRRLGPQDLGLILDLQERIRASLADPDVFQTSTAEFVAYCLADGGLCYGVSHGTGTVAYRMVYFPRDRDFNLAKDLPLPPAEYGRVAHWDTIAVLPEWRGHGLARLMNGRALDDVSGLGIRHLCATSSPRNPAGVGSLMRAGFRPVRLVRKFGGKLRFLFYRPTPEPWPVKETTATEPPQRSLPFSDTAGLDQAFREGWIGVDIDTDRTGPRLRLRRHPLPFTSQRI